MPGGFLKAFSWPCPFKKNFHILENFGRHRVHCASHIWGLAHIFCHLRVSFSYDFASLPSFFISVITKNNTKCSYYSIWMKKIGSIIVELTSMRRERPLIGRERPPAGQRGRSDEHLPLAVLQSSTLFFLTNRNWEITHVTQREQALGHRLLLLHESPASQADIRRRIRRIALRQFASIDFAVIQCRVYHIIST